MTEEEEIERKRGRWETSMEEKLQKEGGKGQRKIPVSELEGVE